MERANDSQRPGCLLALIAVPQLIQDDRRPVDACTRNVKHAEPVRHADVDSLVDQALHLTTLFLVALAAHALA